MKTIVNKFPKEKIQTLETTAFGGRIFVVETEEDAEKAVDYLLSQGTVGLDTETKPTFKKGDFHKVALLQASSEDTCFLFRLNKTGVPDCVVRLLTDPTLLRIGLSWHDDSLQLHHRRDFKMGGYVELQTLAGMLGVEDKSLQKLYANILGKKINKSQQLSNWEADTLTDKQQLYAATDAWACIQLYREMQKMREEGYELTVLPTPEPTLPMQPAEGENSEEATQKKKRKPAAKKTRKKKTKKAEAEKKEGEKDEKKDETETPTTKAAS